MDHEKFSQQQGQGGERWGSLREVPFRPGTDSENDPLGDSRHYWAPEMDGDSMCKQRQTEELSGAARQRAEVARNSEQEPDPKSRAKALNFLQWRSIQPKMDFNDSRVHQELGEIIGARVPEKVSDAAEKQILYDIRDGVYGDDDVRFFVEHISTPNSKLGNQAVLDSLSTRQERRFLANFTGQGFNGINNLEGDDIVKFLERYPTPADFIDSMENLIQDVVDSNGARKGAEYQVAAETFLNKIYGRRYKYHKQFEELGKEADKLPDTYEVAGEKLPKNTGVATVARRTMASVRDLVRKNAQNLTGPEFAQRLRSETLKYRHESERESQDSVLVDSKRGLYGVFDGAGGIAGGQAASRLACRTVESLAEQYSLGEAGQLAGALTIAGAKIVSASRNNKRIGITTGALAQIVNRGETTRSVVFASAGDSRIYIVHADGSVKQLTRDEGYKNVVENYLGPGATREYDDAGFFLRDKYGDRTQNVTQYGEHGLIRGDRIVICSDGITGDEGSDLMSPEELGYYVSKSKTAQDAADNLLGYARKLDDRSVVVVDAYPAESSVVDKFLKRFAKKK